MSQRKQIMLNLFIHAFRGCLQHVIDRFLYVQFIFPIHNKLSYRCDNSSGAASDYKLAPWLLVLSPLGSMIIKIEHDYFNYFNFPLSGRRLRRRDGEWSHSMCQNLGEKFVLLCVRYNMKLREAEKYICITEIKLKRKIM